MATDIEEALWADDHPDILDPGPFVWGSWALCLVAHLASRLPIPVFSHVPCLVLDSDFLTESSVSNHSHLDSYVFLFSYLFQYHPASF